ncbi:unnamed protein product [Rotaria sp. Silwood2]|nr:unnamed protein product [Rotaria sp. Silwood2]
MGQYFSQINEKILDLTNQHDTDFTFDSVVSKSDPDDILLSLYLKNPCRTNDSIDKDPGHSIKNSDKRFIKQIQNDLSKLTHSQAWNNIDSEISQILIENLRDPLIEYFGEAMQEVETIWKLQNELRESLAKNTISNETTSIGLDYLKSVGAYPDTQLVTMNENQFTGQFISSIILAHIDFDNENHWIEQFNKGSIDSSFSFDFHPDTFKQLFLIIEQLIDDTKSERNPTTKFILIVCVRLFTTHLKFFCSLESNINKDLFSINDEWSKSYLWERFQSSNDINLTTFATDIELHQWFQLFFQIVSNHDEQFQSTILCQEASRALIYLLDKTTSSFIEKLSFIHKHIFENKHPVLIEQLWFELNRKVTLLSWIEVLCDEKENQAEKSVAFHKLHLLIDIYLNPSNDFEKEQRLRIKELLLSFQKLLLSRMILQSCKIDDIPFIKSNIEIDEIVFSTSTVTTTTGISSLMVNYITRIVVNHIETDEVFNDFLDSILLTWCFLVNTPEKTNFAVLQPIFTAVLPQLADYMLQNHVHEANVNTHLHSLSWLLARMTQFLIVGSSRNSLEKKYVDQLNSILFSNGLEQILENKTRYLSDLFQSNLALYSQFIFDDYQEQSSLDNEFLMSIYANTGPGAQLIDKMRLHIKEKHRLLQKSIEKLANDACAALFAVYIKHYRRINLAKLEASRTDNEKPHSKLLTLFEYANHVQTLFVTIKGQGGDCQELCNHIKTNALFLLLTVKENHLIPIIHEESIQTATDVTFTGNVQENKVSKLMRENSRWTTAKHIFRILRNTLRVFNQLKKLIKSKKELIQQKQDYENLLHEIIDIYVYGNISKASILATIQEKKSISDDLVQCMYQQYERAMTRLITYRFSETFIRKLLDTQDENRIHTILTIYLPHLRQADVQWSYLNNIEASNSILKEDIGNRYYSCIKHILSYSLQSINSERTNLIVLVFNLLNISYQSADIYHLHRYQFVETIFTSWISSIKKFDDLATGLKMKFIAYNWFRLFVLRLCENIQIEEVNGITSSLLQEQQDFIFNKLIFNELKQLKKIFETTTENQEPDSTTEKNDSLNHIAFSWFLTKNDTSNISNFLSSKLDIDLCINQWMVLLLRCIHMYPNALSICTTIDYIDEFLSIYHRSQHISSILLALKILRYLISFSSETTNEITNIWIKNILTEIFNSIDGNFRIQQIKSDIITELINFYRTIMSVKSAWQSMATLLVVENITSSFNDLKSLDNIDENQMNNLVASLYILGGYIQSYGLGSIVKTYVEDENLNNLYLALITEIKIDVQDSNTSEKSSYFIQYSQLDKAEWITVDQLKLEIDVPPPNLFSLPQANEMVHLILDKLGSFIQMDTSRTDSIVLLQLKRCSIGALYHLLNDRKLIEIFMQKSYASVLAELAIASMPSKNRLALHDLREFNKEHLEQYCLSLNNCNHLKTIADNDNDKENVSHDIKQNNITDTSSFIIWNNDPIHRDPQIVDALSFNSLKYNGWKVKASEAEIELYKQGRIGNDEIVLAPMPHNIADTEVFEECGNTHRFRGRIDTSHDSKHNEFVTFILNNLQVNKGKWYFCIKLPLGGLVQVGWATVGFSPQASNGLGIGDDSYSWSYDGSRHVLFHNGRYEYPTDDISWKENDVCGCGIEIDDENTRIKYWLNGKFLGTAFAQESYMGSTTVKCNIKPNGSNTAYYPGVSLQSYSYCSNCCEFILCPEDMTECPLPDGYKPLLLPELVNTENSIVAYPFSAYLIGDDIQNYFHTSRLSNSRTRLRDFVNEHHLETAFSLDDHHLILSETSNGFPFPIDNLASSLTISFDFKLITSTDNSSNNNTNIQLFTLTTMEIFSVEIPKLSEMNEETQIAIVFQPNEQQIKLYMNNRCRIFYGRFDHENTVKLMLHLLPNTSAGIRNLAIWKYALSDEDIRRLFTYGLSYVAIDYQQLKEYRRQVNMFTFTKNQQAFVDELLVPFNQPFEENLWKTRKIQIDHDESIYFKSIDDTDRSVVQFFGNKTYLTLDISTTQYSELTLILDIFIPNFPKNNEQLTLVILNSQLSICLAHDGRLFLSSYNRILQTSTSTYILNEYVRFVISINDNYAKIYMNSSLIIEYDKFTTEANPIYLFRENDLTKNTINDDTLRIECKLISFLNRTVPIDDRMNSSECSLDSLIAPPLSLSVSSLSAIGYKATWIESIIKSSKTFNIQMFDTLIREQKEQLIQVDLKHRRDYYLNILSKLAPSIDQNKLENLIMSIKLENDDELLVAAELMFACWNDLQRSTISTDDNNENESADNKQFHQIVRGLCTQNSLIEWLHDKSTNNEDDDLATQLVDLNQSILERSIATTSIEKSHKIEQKSIQYSHQHISYQQYSNSRMACEHGLISIYTREIIFNLLNIWSNNGQNLFPLEKLANYQSIVTLLRLMDYHYSSISEQTNENIDKVSVIAKSIVKTEIDELQKHMRTVNEMDSDLFQSKTPFLNQLQKYLIGQLILCLATPSFLSKNSHEETSNINEQIIMKQPNVRFLLTLINILAELIADKSTMNQQEIDLIIPFVFPEMLINLLFDLFLINSMYQTEIVVLRLFTTLIRASEKFHLNKQMIDFLFQLLIELSNNELSMKKFRLIVMDIFYVLWIRQKNQCVINNHLEATLAACPENVRNLWTLIDFIDALVDKSKQKPLPEAFRTQLNTILDNDNNITADDFNKSHSHFDSIADRELIRFMNKDSILDLSFDEFIASLPIESEPNRIFYKTYPSLSTIPSNFIQIRVKCIYLLNAIFEKIQPIVDLSLAPGQSVLADKLRNVKAYLLYKKKFVLFEESLQKTSAGCLDRITVILDTVKATENSENGENTMFYQAYEQLQKEAHKIFRSEDERLWHATYVGMNSIDAGGPYRDSITCICSDICSTRLPLFILCPNGRTNTGLNRDRWVPNVFSPHESIPNTFKNQYRFVGQLMGIAIRKKHYLDLKFPIFLWKQLAREPVTIDDIKAIDLQSFKIIEEVERHFVENELINTDIDIEYLFSSVMSELRFDVVSSAGITYELVPGGKEIPITASNFKDFCTKYREYRLNEFCRQIECICQGMYSVVPFYYLSQFTADELEDSVCGKGHIDIELLKRNTYYGDSYNQNSPTIERFWTVLSEMFNEEQKKSFITFVWGRSTLPLCNEDFTNKFCINPYYILSNEVDTMLPRSHTCNFSLDLPEYSTTEIMYERLNYAITYCSSIDGD